ncbi:MAG: hypothetical protein K9L70_08160, partial [Thiohalocapsa sp.]|nr:hypothetical protein [Thiohalocapsa sp.]
RHRGIAASRHRGIAASRHRGIAASRHRGIAAGMRRRQHPRILVPAPGYLAGGAASGIARVPRP